MITAQDIFNEARELKVSPARVAFHHGMTPSSNMWLDIKEGKERDVTYSETELTSEHRTDLLSRYAIAAARAVQFPINTSFMHLLGCVASAMTRNFSVEYYHSELPVSLYVVTSQPPSAGKTAINSMHMNPVKIEYDNLSKKMEKQIIKINLRIEELMKAYKEAGNQNAKALIGDDIAREKEKLEELYTITYPLTDATPEAVQHQAIHEGGFFNLISDEASVLNTCLGLSYGKEGGKANAEVILKGWDGGFIGSARVGRGVSSGYVLGNISVIAQDESIDAILAAGDRGNGLSERFLMLREQSMLGYREHWDMVNDCPVSKPMPDSLRSEYARFIHNVVSAEKTKLTLHNDSARMIGLLRNQWEKNFLPGGKWDHVLLRGAMGKADKQIIRLAAIFHAAENWCDGGNRSKIIGENEISRAISVYDALTKTFTDAVESNGYAGERSEFDVVAEKLRSAAQKGKNSVTVKWLYDSLKNVRPFKGIPKIYDRLRSSVLPSLEEDGYCVFIGNTVHINPRLK